MSHHLGYPPGAAKPEVGTRDSEQTKFTKVYNWLMSTGERKLIKSEVKAPEPTAQAPKKKFKI